jgi:thiol-disulfide isomerase/thioredoxin
MVLQVLSSFSFIGFFITFKPDMTKIIIKIVFFFFALSLWSCTQPKKEAEIPEQEINELPYLNYKTLDGEPSSTRALPGNSILILFNTECDHCQHEAREISERSEAFKNHELLFLASDSLHKIENFAKTYGLTNKPNVNFGWAEYRDVFKNFGGVSTPAIYIFSRERKFVKSFFGQTPIEELIKYL